MHGKAVRIRHCPATVSGESTPVLVTASIQSMREGERTLGPQVRRPIQPHCNLFRGGKIMAASCLSLLLASVFNVFAVESPTYAKAMVAAAHEITARFPDVHFTIRTTEQANDMEPDDLKKAFDQASIVILSRTYGDVAAKIRSAFPPAGSSSKVVFTAHADSELYELNRYGSNLPFRNVSREQIDQISS